MMIDIPRIGYGPMTCGYSSNTVMRTDNIFYRGANKVIFRPIQEKIYVNTVSHALIIGFRLIDYSATYGNEKLIGKAIKKSGVPRSDLFITGRVSNKAQFNKNVREEFFNTLKAYGVSYIDLYQIHWPVAGLYLDTWKEMEKLLDEGYIRYLGCCNCHEHHIIQLIQNCKIKPAVNQIEIHPLFTQKSLVCFCQRNNIVVEAYTPIARYDDRLVRLPVLKNMSYKYGKSIVQIILRWHIQNNVVPVIRSMNKKRQIENIDVFDFELNDEEMQIIDNLNINSRLRYDPDNCDYTIL